MAMGVKHTPASAVIYSWLSEAISAADKQLLKKIEKGQFSDLMGSVYLLNRNFCLHLCTIRIRPNSWSNYSSSAE